MSQSTYRAHIEGSDISFDVKNNETLVRAAARQGISFPSLCNVGECGSCRCRLRSGRIKLKKDISHHVPLPLLKRGDILGCQSQIQSDVVLNVPTLSPAATSDGAPIQTSARIASQVMLNDDTVELTLALDNPVTYRPGQYGHLTLPGVPALATDPRSYSFASGDLNRAPNTVQFHIRHVPGGAFTGWLFEKDRCDEEIEFSGPFGDFGWHEQTQKPLFIAGGSGFAPIHALLDQCLETAKPLDAVLMYGARTRPDIYCLTQVAQLQKRWPGNLTFFPVLSEEPETSDWPGERGYLHEYLGSPAINAPGRTAYMCGPPPMIDACLEALADVIAPENIHYDKFLNRSHMTDTATD